ncbi:MAG: multidrug efflux system protein EmrA [Acidobacteria bacterium]|nr:multidrug efflux system protein EmrA [Acidobacteriota bacterium]
MDREIAPEVRRRRIVRRVSVVVVAVGAGLFLLAASLRWLEPSVRRLDLQIAVAELGPVDATLQAGGTVMPAAEQVISSPVEARVLRVAHRAGDAVKAGDEILTLETSATRLDVERLLDRIAQKESEDKQLRLRLEESSATLHAQIEQKSLDRDILRLKAEQNDRLHAAGLATQEEALMTATAAKKGEIELVQLQAALERGSRSGAAQLAASQGELQLMQKELDESRRQLALATRQVDRDGVLTWVLPDAGATVRRGDLIARIADLSSFRVSGTISDVYASRLLVGQRVRVVVDEAKLEGSISAIDPRMEGGVARFDVALAAAPRDEPFVLRGRELQRTPVHWGLAGEDYLEVLAGLRPGDQVVVSNMDDYAGVSKLRLK